MISWIVRTLNALDWIDGVHECIGSILKRNGGVLERNGSVQDWIDKVLGALE